MARTASSDWQRVFLALGTLILVVGVLYFAQALLIPVVSAILLTFILSPLVSILQHKGLSRVFSVILVVGLVFLLLAGVFVTFFVQVKELAAELPEYKHQIIERVNAIRDLWKGSFVDDFLSSLHDITKTVKQEMKDEPVPVTVESSPFLLVHMIAGSAIDFFVKGGLVLLLVIFMLIRREDLRNRMIRLFGHAHLTTTTKALDEASQRISQYLLMQALVNVCFGISLGMGLYVIGVPFSFIWGFLGALLRYIPYLGPWLAALFPVVLSLAVMPSWGPALVVLGYIALLEISIANFLEPWLYGKTTGISEVALLIAIAFWTWIWGPIGLILATPLTTCLVVLGRHVSQLAFFNHLLGDEPVLETHVAFYQRLLARDQDETTELVEDYLKKQPVQRIYDEVFVPGLLLAKKDLDRGELSPEDHRAVVETVREVFHEVVLPEQEALRADKPGDSLDNVIDPAILVFGLPAYDETDELLLEMFKETVPPCKCTFKVLSAKLLQGEMLAQIKAQEPQVVLAGMLAGGRLTRIRYLCKKIHAQIPNQKILVGCWGLATKTEQLRARLQAVGVADVGVAFQDSLDQLNPLLHLSPAFEEAQTV